MKKYFLSLLMLSLPMSTRGFITTLSCMYNPLTKQKVALLHDSYYELNYDFGYQPLQDLIKRQADGLVNVAQVLAEEKEDFVFVSDILPDCFDCERETTCLAIPKLFCKSTQQSEKKEKDSKNIYLTDFTTQVSDCQMGSLSFRLCSPYKEVDLGVLVAITLFVNDEKDQLKNDFLNWLPNRIKNLKAYKYASHVLDCYRDLEAKLEKLPDFPLLRSGLKAEINRLFNIIFRTFECQFDSLLFDFILSLDTQESESILKALCDFNMLLMNMELLIEANTHKYSIIQCNSEAAQTLEHKLIEAGWYFEYKFSGQANKIKNIHFKDLRKISCHTPVNLENKARAIEYYYKNKVEDIFPEYLESRILHFFRKKID